MVPLAAVDLRSPLQPLDENLHSVNVNFGWEIDLWGRIRRSNEAAKAQYLATEDARRGVLLSLVSDVARTYFQLRELDEELVISKKTVEAFRETENLFQRKLSEGAASALETAYASAASNQVAATLPDIERRIEATENQLNVLLGRNPAAIARGRRVQRTAAASRDPGGAAVGRCSSAGPTSGRRSRSSSPPTRSWGSPPRTSSRRSA